jgi:hypothetical protein
MMVTIGELLVAFDRESVSADAAGLIGAEESNISGVGGVKE